MQRRVSLVIALVVVLLTAFSGFASASSDSFTIKVQATGIVLVAPTKAQLWIGAKSDGATAEEALTSSNEVTQKLVEIFSEFTSPELIKTSEFNMYQNERWDDDIRQSVPDGFSVRHVFEVHILDLTKVAAFLDEVTQAGANIIYGLQYGVHDYRPAREDAFRRAMEDAWWKAAVLADANDTDNIKLESVEETYFYSTEYGTERIGQVGDGADAFMPGQLQVTVNIIATFRAEPRQH
ncbi:MAG: SIMPL domain-containing protein [Firmicutes bacterium]|nr:SIMPL domain-containing protein [Bacillota bacterium]